MSSEPKNLEAARARVELPNPQLADIEKLVLSVTCSPSTAAAVASDACAPERFEKLLTAECDRLGLRLGWDETFHCAVAHFSVDVWSISDEASYCAYHVTLSVNDWMLPADPNARKKPVWLTVWRSGWRGAQSSWTLHQEIRVLLMRLFHEFLRDWYVSSWCSMGLDEIASGETTIEEVTKEGNSHVDEWLTKGDPIHAGGALDSAAGEVRTPGGDDEEPEDEEDTDAGLIAAAAPPAQRQPLELLPPDQPPSEPAHVVATGHNMASPRRRREKQKVYLYAEHRRAATRIGEGVFRRGIGIALRGCIIREDTPAVNPLVEMWPVKGTGFQETISLGVVELGEALYLGDGSITAGVRRAIELEYRAEIGDGMP